MIDPILKQNTEENFGCWHCNITLMILAALNRSLLEFYPLRFAFCDY